MSRSQGDQRGKRINSEIYRTRDFQIGPGGKVYCVNQGDRTGSPAHKRSVKRAASKMRRRASES